MNKLGFYIENSTIPHLRDAIRQVKPPTILIHAGDRGLLRDIRREYSPNSFIIARMFVEQGVQRAWLDSSDPAGRGRAFAERIIYYDFGLASEEGANGRLLIDAWMGLNEPLRGPASFPNDEVNDDFRRRAAALDSFQVAFLERLRQQGLEGVAFNFAAGNYVRPRHYLDWFPASLESYTFLGFHEYGWPTLMENESLGTATAALFYRRCMTGIRDLFGDQHEAIITEAGLARMYRHPLDSAGDVGWLYPGETISEARYWESLRWYNDRMVEDAYVRGACLYQVGHAGRWATFRHLGQDNQRKPILLISKIATLNEPSAPLPPEPTAPSPTEPGLAALQQQLADMIAILMQADQLLADYVAQLDRIETMLDGMTPVATQAASLPGDLEALLERIQEVKRELAGLQAVGSVRPSLLEELRQQTDDLESQIRSLQPGADKAATLDDQVSDARQVLRPLAEHAGAARSLRSDVNALLIEARRLQEIAGLPPASLAQPPLNDVRLSLGPVASPSGRPRAEPEAYPLRELQDISQIIVHHTMTKRDASPETIDGLHRKRGLPGIAYHFLVNEDGTTHWTQPLEAVVPQSRNREANQKGVAVALAGNFSRSCPGDAQLMGAAQVIAWLLNELGLNRSDVVGRTEVDPSVISPGSQWLQGVCFKEVLLEIVDDILAISR
ncbi:MAG: N-acetylmuramoyl-L-alanine amidase [Chloroflexota bacterium]|nr:N-acetylmuramoyl-L-alanine amidase [Chloroflexota bacterium]